MRFSKTASYDFTDTPRKRAAVLVRQRKDREKLPLFAEEIGEQQPSVDEVMRERDERWRRNLAERRAARAAKWWAVRARIALLGDADRRAFLRYWNNHRWYPGDPSYLGTVLHMFEDGRLVRIGDEIIAAADIEWARRRDAKIAAMTDAELDHMIQTHISMMFVELGRAERQRRQEARA